MLREDLGIRESSLGQEKVQKEGSMKQAAGDVYGQEKEAT